VDFLETHTMTLSRQMALNDEIERLAARCKLDGWANLVETVQVPTDIAAALITGRSELLMALRPRALSADECGKLYALLGVLIETNRGLREHAEQVAGLVDNWMSQMTGLQGVARQIDHFANFRKIGSDDDR
jgi:hypothetical protein